MLNERSCGAIVFRRQKTRKYFLLLHYSAGHWDFPKGHAEKQETEEQTALREVEEETGISRARLLPGFKEKIHYYYQKDKQKVFKQVTFFLVETRQEQAKLSLEHQGFKWLEFKPALQTLTFKTAKNLLEKAMGFLEKSYRAPNRKINQKIFKN